MQLKSNEMLKQFMEYKGIRTVRDLAAAAKVSHSTIGHLHSGARKTCRPETATAIEKALGAPKGLLFEPRASNVVRHVRQPAAA